MKRLLTLSIMIGLVAACSSTKSDIKDTEASFTSEAQLSNQEVTVEGYADIRQAGIDETLDRAYRDAQRKAIEKSLGTIYSAKTVVDSGVFIEQNILAKQEGYIRKWEKIGNYRKEDEVVYVTIKALVGIDKLKQDTLALEELQQKMSRPRTIILINEIVMGKPNISTTGTAYGILAKKFMEKNFTVIERAGIPETDIKQLLSGITQDNSDIISSSAFKIGKSSRAEVIIAGKVETSKGEKQIVYDTELNPTYANLNFKVISIDDGRILATTAKNKPFPFKTSDADASARAIQGAAADASDDLITQVLDKWEEVLNNGNELTLKVTGLDMTAGFKFEKVLKRSYREVKEVNNKGLEDGVTEFTLKFLGNAKDLAMALSTKNIGYKITVKGYQANVVTITIGK